MTLKISLFRFVILMLVFAAAMISFGFTFSKAVEEKDKSYIVDLHGEHWDVTRAKSIGFDPDRFRHGIGRNAFIPLDDTHLKDNSPNVSSNTRVIGIADGEEARA